MPKTGIQDPKTGKFRPTNKYIFYKKNSFDDKAPSKVSLSDYSKVGFTRALYLKQAAREWMNSEELDLRPPKIGDIIFDETNNKYLILTPTYVWAEVEIKD